MRASAGAFTTTLPNWGGVPGTAGPVGLPGPVDFPGGSEVTGASGPINGVVSPPTTVVDSGGRESVFVFVPVSKPPNGKANTAATAATRTAAIAAPDQSRRVATGWATGLLGIRAPDDVGVVRIVTVLADDGSRRD